MNFENFRLDLMMSGEKIGEATIVNPLVILDDTKCEEVLLLIKNSLPLNEKEISLINTCLDVVLAEAETDVMFGPQEILGLANLAVKYPDLSNEILACSEHINHTLHIECTDPEKVIMSSLSAKMVLANLFSGDDVEDSESSEGSDEEQFEKMSKDFSELRELMERF